MSRNSSGTYSLPLADVVAGNTIESSWANTTLSDIETELTDSLSRSGKGNMSAALKIIAGTVSAPGLSFTSEANSGLYRASSNDLRFAVNGAENWRATASGFRITGDLVLGTAGEGVDFSANTGASGTGVTETSSLFDWYEEGTWTPTIQDSSFSNSESQAYTTQLGYYTRIGRVVFINGYIKLSSKGTLSGNLIVIAQLPFTVANTTEAVSVLNVAATNNFNLSDGDTVNGTFTESTTRATLYVFDGTAAASTLNATEITDTTQFAFSGHYIV